MAWARKAPRFTYRNNSSVLQGLDTPRGTYKFRQPAFRELIIPIRFSRSSLYSLRVSRVYAIMAVRIGTIKAFFLVAVCCVGSFLFAYDTGIIGGVLTLKSFQDDFRYSNAEKTNVNSNSNSLLQAGGQLLVPSFLARH